MKYLILFFSIISLENGICQSLPGMGINQALEVLETPSESTEAGPIQLCHTPGSAPNHSSSEYSSEYFLPTIECQIQCENGPEESIKLDQIFRPRDQGLAPGDGSDGISAPWSAFTAKLEAWSRFGCLRAGSAQCNGLEKVQKAEFKRMTSGQWSLDRRVTCPTREQIAQIQAAGRDPNIVFPGHVPILSPFDSQSGANTGGQPGQGQLPNLPFPNLGRTLEGPENDLTLRPVDTYSYWEAEFLALEWSNLPENEQPQTAEEIRAYLFAQAGVSNEGDFIRSRQTANDIPAREPCENIIRGRACYGDCVTYPENSPMRQYMATNQVGTENVGNIAICADNLIQFFESNSMSRSAKEVYCEKFATDTLINDRSSGITCAAYRIRIDCSSLIN